jgi:hypothetical protein
MTQRQARITYRRRKRVIALMRKGTQEEALTLSKQKEIEKKVAIVHLSVG